ncbi:Uncharacterised protein [Mycobacteroides abscessus subsp. abscessus]|nr:Uncharacterised protein [Mycobacteroides abscessus subsp. abscessus]
MSPERVSRTGSSPVGVRTPPSFSIWNRSTGALFWSRGRNSAPDRPESTLCGP